MLPPLQLDHLNLQPQKQYLSEVKEEAEFPYSPSETNPTPCPGPDIELGLKKPKEIQGQEPGRDATKLPCIFKTKEKKKLRSSQIIEMDVTNKD